MLEPISATPGRLLVLDEDPASLRATNAVLEEVGYFVLGCSSTDDAILAIVRDDEYDAVLCVDGAGEESLAHFQDQVAAVDPALAERIVCIGPRPRENERYPFLASPLDPRAVRACIDEFVMHRTIAPVACPGEACPYGDWSEGQGPK